jgi:hypothetical protein
MTVQPRRPFAAVHESGAGTNLPIRNVRYMALLG